MRVERVKLTKISSQSFEHEADRKAIEALRKTVGFDRLIRALDDLAPNWPEEEFAAVSMATTCPLPLTALKPCPLTSGMRPVMGLFMVERAGELPDSPTDGASPKACGVPLASSIQ